MKLVVIGNCQARPLAALLAAAPGVTVADPIVLHLAGDEDQAAHDAVIAGADLILAQATAANFRPRHLASDALRAAHPERVLIWPNLFYAGQQPNLRYLTHATLGRIYGPLDIYHDCEILRAWYLDRLRFDPVPPKDDPEDVHYRSLSALREREQACDVVVSDLIKIHRHEMRLFFTFNHPSRWLLERLAARLAEKTGLLLALDEIPKGEPLGRIVPPAVLDEKDCVFQGLVIDRPTGNLIKQTRSYTQAELRDVAFFCYDRQCEALSEVQHLRYTPQT